MSPTLKSELQRRDPARLFIGIRWWKAAQLGTPARTVMDTICCRTICMPRCCGWTDCRSPPATAAKLPSAAAETCSCPYFAIGPVTSAESTFPPVRVATRCHGSWSWKACALVLIRSADGTPVTTVDLSRLLRQFPLLLHEFVQHSDRSCVLTLRPMPRGLAAGCRSNQGFLAEHAGAIAAWYRNRSYAGRSDGRQGHAVSKRTVVGGFRMQMPANDPAQDGPLDSPSTDRPHRVYVALKIVNRACPWCSTCSSPAGRSWLTTEQFLEALPGDGAFQVQLKVNSRSIGNSGNLSNFTAPIRVAIIWWFAPTASSCHGPNMRSQIGCDD